MSKSQVQLRRLASHWPVTYQVQPSILGALSCRSLSNSQWSRRADHGTTVPEKVAGDALEPQSSSNAEANSASSTSWPTAGRQSAVPSSHIGRLWQYGTLASSMAVGALGAGLRRAAGGRDSGDESLLLNATNVETLVSKLSHMRGAALKIGQMLSFQDLKLLPQSIRDVLQRVQDGANHMPPKQRDTVLSRSLGSDWRQLFKTFDETPLAAASIGQVHRAQLKVDGRAVAVKVQYPGVAESIDSDLDNLSLLLRASGLLPKGLFLDRTIANARKELAWECDYRREAECARRFKKLLSGDQCYTVPAIIAEASGDQVLTAEFMDGQAVGKLAASATQEVRDWLGSQILRLCLRELTEFGFMQTDPNWSNFLYNGTKLQLLDFGASREFSAKFINPYVSLLEAAARSERDRVHQLSVQLGYLTGLETAAMLEAHLASVTALAEPFSPNQPQPYHFHNQTITSRVQELIPTMLRDRLVPPPEETYSLHRKLSGAFLLCARLGSTINCRELFDAAVLRSKDLKGGMASL